MNNNDLQQAIYSLETQVFQKNQALQQQKQKVINTINDYKQKINESLILSQKIEENKQKVAQILQPQLTQQQQDFIEIVGFSKRNLEDCIKILDIVSSIPLQIKQLSEQQQNKQVDLVNILTKLLQIEQQIKFVEQKLEVNKKASAQEIFEINKLKEKFSLYFKPFNDFSDIFKKYLESDMPCGMFTELARENEGQIDRFFKLLIAVDTQQPGNLKKKWEIICKNIGKNMKENFTFQTQKPNFQQFIQDIEIIYRQIVKIKAYCTQNLPQNLQINYQSEIGSKNQRNLHDLLPLDDIYLIQVHQYVQSVISKSIQDTIDQNELGIAFVKQLLQFETNYYELQEKYDLHIKVLRNDNIISDPRFQITQLDPNQLQSGNVEKMYQIYWPFYQKILEEKIKETWKTLNSEEKIQILEQSQIFGFSLQNVEEVSYKILYKSQLSLEKTVASITQHFEEFITQKFEDISKNLYKNYQILLKNASKNFEKKTTFNQGLSDTIKMYYDVLEINNGLAKQLCEILFKHTGIIVSNILVQLYQDINQQINCNFFEILNQPQKVNIFQYSTKQLQQFIKEQNVIQNVHCIYDRIQELQTNPQADIIYYPPDQFKYEKTGLQSIDLTSIVQCPYIIINDLYELQTEIINKKIIKKWEKYVPEDRGEQYFQKAFKYLSEIQVHQIYVYAQQQLYAQKNNFNQLFLKYNDKYQQVISQIKESMKDLYREYSSRLNEIKQVEYKNGFIRLLFGTVFASYIMTFMNKQCGQFYSEQNILISEMESMIQFGKEIQVSNSRLQGFKEQLQTFTRFNNEVNDTSKLTPFLKMVYYLLYGTEQQALAQILQRQQNQYNREEFNFYRDISPLELLFLWQ